MRNHTVTVVSIRSYLRKIRYRWGSLLRKSPFLPTYNHFLYAAVFVAGGLSFWSSYAVRFDFTIPATYSDQCLWLLPFVMLMKVCVFYLLRGHAADWRYISLRDTFFGVYYSAACSAIILIHFLLHPTLSVPRGVVALDFLLTMVLVSLVRVTFRLVQENLAFVYSNPLWGTKRTRAIIIGAGDIAASVIRESRQNLDWNLNVTAIFDDEPSAKGLSINGVSIRGGLHDLKSYVARDRTELAIIAIPSPDATQMQRINQSLSELSISVRTVASLIDRSGAEKSPRQRTVGIAPLLAREELVLEPPRTAVELSDSIPVIRPMLPEMDEVFDVVKASYESGMVTGGKLAKLFEHEVARFCQVDHAVAVSSGTSGLIIAFAAMDFPEAAEVIVPSFTFAATIQALLWDRLTPVFVDCLPGTMTIDPGEVVKAISPRTAAIYPVNIYGLPPDIEELEEISRKKGLPIIYDSAQGLGSTYRGRPAGGFGTCEVFSLSPAKVITAMEGGVVTTNDDELANKLRAMRDYGKGPGGEEMVSKGLSARMIEFDAAVGLLNLRKADSLISTRLRMIGYYEKRLKSLRGCSVQEYPSDRTSSGSHFALLVGEEAAMDRDGLQEVLKAQKIQTKRYFFPPTHVQRAFTDRPHRIVGDLPVTVSCSRHALALPLYSEFSEEQQDRVCSAIESVLRA